MNSVQIWEICLFAVKLYQRLWALLGVAWSTSIKSEIGFPTTPNWVFHVSIWESQNDPLFQTFTNPLTFCFLLMEGKGGLPCWWPYLAHPAPVALAEENPWRLWEPWFPVTIYRGSSQACVRACSSLSPYLGNGILQFVQRQWAVIRSSTVVCTSLEYTIWGQYQNNKHIWILRLP